MSWIHSFSKEDFTSYVLSAAKIDLISYSVDDLEKTLKESFDAGRYAETQNILDDGVKKLDPLLTSVREKGDLPLVLRTLMESKILAVDEGFSEISKRIESKLLRVKIGLDVPMEDPAEDYWELFGGVYSETQHLSEDDLDYQILTIEAEAGYLLKDIISKCSRDLDYFRKASNVGNFKRRVNKLVSRSDISLEVIEQWVDTLSQHLVFRDDSSMSRFSEFTSRTWLTAFWDMRRMIEGIHRALIMLETKAHNDWAQEKTDEWVDTAIKNQERVQSHLAKLMKSKAALVVHLIG